MGVEHLYKREEVPFPLYRVLVRDASDEELMELSREGGVALSLDEMKRMQNYFRRLGRDPTDVEFQALGQAWSEHSCYKSSKKVLREFITGIEAPQVILPIVEDAGVVEFDEDHAYVAALESHNHPSAIEPYGGAATGVGGILRDVVCMGAQPVALVDPLFFAPLDTAEAELPRGVKHPRYLFRGVVAGIRDYGNRVGIPTVAGNVVFHPGYLSNCLVNVGCVGVCRKEHIVRSRVKKAGSVFIMAGGRTGRDGIHGVTFASLDLHEESEEESRGAVQLGDPILKEPLIHACLECVHLGLVEGMKDFGGGGMSSVTGEMAYAGGFGAEVYLDRVPLKEPDMAPWEIWISESQERMMLVVSPENVDRVMEIFRKWDVEATVVGKVIEEKVLRIFYHDHVVLEMDLDFYTAGPVYDRPWKEPEREEKTAVWEEENDYTDVLLEMLSHPDVASRDWVVRQYDHEVRGSTVIKPLQGRAGCEVHGDAAVIRPLPDTWRGLAIASDVNPFYTEIDPYWGSALAVDEACRNIVSVGAVPHSMLDCLNFGNPEKPDRMWAFRESARALGDMARALGVPYVSGNVSFYNEGPGGAIPPTPTIMAIGIVEDVRRSATVDLKRDGNPLFLVGETAPGMGGSLFLRLKGLADTHLPRVDISSVRQKMHTLAGAIQKGLVVSCHDISEGGVAVALAEMAMGGNVGVEVDLHSDCRPSEALFSEAPTRWVVEVPADVEKEFLSHMGGVRVEKIGVVGGGVFSLAVNGKPMVRAEVETMREMWSRPMWEAMG